MQAWQRAQIGTELADGTDCLPETWAPGLPVACAAEAAVSAGDGTRPNGAGAGADAGTGAGAAPRASTATGPRASRNSLRSVQCWSAQS